MDKSQMNEPSNWSLLARYLSGECSPEEENELQVWLTNSPENKRLLKFMEGVWSTSEAKPEASDVDALWKEMAARGEIATNREDDAPVREIRWSSVMTADNYRFLRLAVSFMLIVTIGYVLNMFMPWAQHDELIMLTVDNARREKLALDDGTSVVLDAGSTLRYPAEFTGDTREVFLSGEGYFEVTSDIDKPFVVNANHATIRVLGTRFNVRAWLPDQRVTVAVAEGKVSLRAKEESMQQAVVIVKGQASSLTSGGEPTAPDSANIDRYLGWMQNEMRFQDAAISEILFQLERWYDVEFVLSDSSIATERLNVHTSRESLADILELLAALTDFEYQRADRVIYLTRRQNNEK